MDELTARPAAEDLLDTQKSLVRDQISAAWQLHVERIEEQLESGWREHIDRAVGEAFDTLRSDFDSSLETAVTARLQQELDGVREHARRRMSERLNQSARRLDQAEDLTAWIASLLDGAFAFSPLAILFSLNSTGVKYEGHRSGEEREWTELTSFRKSLDEIPAFKSVVDSLDTVICMGSDGELSAELVRAVGMTSDHRISLFPIITGRTDSQRKVSAVLLAASGAEPLDVNVLELIAAHGGATLDLRLARQRAVTAPGADGVVGIAPAAVPVESNGTPVAAEPAPQTPAVLPAPVNEAHARAQRFARVRVAEMRLFHAQQVRAGREQKTLYLLLRDEIDRCRGQYKEEFSSLGIPDFLHVELVRTLAHDDASLLGSEYPGPLL